jgi:hypothetical protein
MEWNGGLPFAKFDKNVKRMCRMAEAKLNREYAVRIIGVGVMMFGMCLWSVYDGKVGWPNQNRVLDRVRPALLATNLTAEAWVEKDDNGVSPLDIVFRASGEKTPAKLVKKVGELRVPEHAVNIAELHEEQAKVLRKTFEEPVYNEHDLQTQTVQAVVTFLFGVGVWGSLAAKARRRFIADERGLRGSGIGGDFAYADIAKINWAKWNDKGIVVLTLKSGRRLTLDGWHFSGITGVVEQIERGRPDLAQTTQKAG